MAFKICKEMTTKASIMSLPKLYEKTSASNKVFHMKHLFNRNISEGGYVVDHLNKFDIITCRLSSAGVNFDDKVRAMLFMLL